MSKQLRVTLTTQHFTPVVTLKRYTAEEWDAYERQLCVRTGERIQALGSEGFDLAQTILGFDTASWAMGADYPRMTPVEDIERFIAASNRELIDWAQKRPQSAE